MSFRIILADDHPLILTGLRSIIDKSKTIGEVIAEAHSVSELFICLEKHTCNLLITDLIMPSDDSNDGLIMFQRLRRIYPNLPIIVLTQIQNRAILRSLIKAGVNGLILKKSLSNELNDAIRQVSSGKIYIGTSIKSILFDEESSGKSNMDSNTPILSAKESEVIRLLASGMSVTQVANHLHRSIKTISTQKKNAMIKLDITSDSALFEYAKMSGLC
ncbi:response regulator [Vibrio cholerae]